MATTWKNRYTEMQEIKTFCIIFEAVRVNDDLRQNNTCESQVPNAYPYSSYFHIVQNYHFNKTTFKLFAISCEQERCSTFNGAFGSSLASVHIAILLVCQLPIPQWCYTSLCHQSMQISQVKSLLDIQCFLQCDSKQLYSDNGDIVAVQQL